MNRKGEQQELFESLKAQGFMRLRIDGVLYEMDNLPKLAKTTKHNIEVVIDRLKIQPHAQQRLTESIETALRLSADKVWVLEEDKIHIFSTKFCVSYLRLRLARIRTTSILF